MQKLRQKEATSQALSVLQQMKSAKDPRHVVRIETVRELFASSFAPQPVGERTRKILENAGVLDKKISEAAPEWPIEKLNKIDLAILRLAVFELTHTDTPPKVIIDEAVELAKQFGSEASPAFINGVMGTILKEKGNEQS